MSVISFAQNLEDIMLWRALSGIKRGFYIDVGAQSPDEGTVTRLFYERGWRGVNLEPHPVFLAQLAARRPKDINLGMAVSDHTGEAEFHCIEETGLSTLDPSVARRAVDTGRSERVNIVPMTTLAEIWDRHVPSGQAVHFLKIDVEGFEEQVIRGADWQRHRPWIVVAEATVPQSSEQNHHQWDPLLVEAGYDFVWFDGLNRFYIARERPELAGAFNAPPNVFDGFRRVEEVSFETRAKEAEARLIAAQLHITALEAENTNLKQTFEAERVQLEAQLTPQPALPDPRAEWARKPLWIRLLFRPSSKPKKLLRRALFHTNGKPRGVFRSLVLHPDGRPHSPFRQWMSSPEYQSLPRAIRPPKVAAPGKTTSLSRDADRIAQRVAALRRSSPHQI